MFINLFAMHHRRYTWVAFALETDLYEYKECMEHMGLGFLSNIYLYGIYCIKWTRNSNFLKFSVVIYAHNTMPKYNWDYKISGEKRRIHHL